ncbi:MAG: YbdK family carboxylate-amine ligase [Gemmatimonadota bacterium]
MEPYSLGVEEEYQLVDPDTGRLRARAHDVLAMDWTDDLHPEIQETILEVGTQVCGSAEELDTALRRLRFQVATAAASQDLVPVAGGLHPFSRWEEQPPVGAERYRRLEARFGRVIRTEHIFGMHVHVALADGVDRARVMTRVRHFIPHLVALSASSPRFEGEDTGYASYRTILAGRLPCSGPPPAFSSDDAYHAFTGALIKAGTLEDRSMVYWSVRPHHRYPTLELRAADVCPAVEDAVALAALARALVATAAEGGALDDPHAGRADREALPADQEALRADEWQAARHGLDARLMGPDGPVPVRDAIRRLLDHVAPTAEQLGDGAALAGVERILERGNAAERIRREAAERGPGTLLVRWLAGETLAGTGLDRPRGIRPWKRSEGRRGVPQRPS